MTLLMSSWTRTACAMACGDRGSSLCWLVDEPSPLLCVRCAEGEEERRGWGWGEGEGDVKGLGGVKERCKLNWLSFTPEEVCNFRGKWVTMEPLYKDTPEIRTPLQVGHCYGSRLYYMDTSRLFQLSQQYPSTIERFHCIILSCNI